MKVALLTCTVHCYSVSARPTKYQWHKYHKTKNDGFEKVISFKTGYSTDIIHTIYIYTFYVIFCDQYVFCFATLRWLSFSICTIKGILLQSRETKIWGNIPWNGLVNRELGGGFKYVLFSSLFGEMIQFDQYFSNGLKPPTRDPYFQWSLWRTSIWIIQHNIALINHPWAEIRSIYMYIFVYYTRIFFCMCNNWILQIQM